MKPIIKILLTAIKSNLSHFMIMKRILQLNEQIDITLLMGDGVHYAREITHDIFTFFCF